MSVRTARVGEAMREILADEIARLKDPRIGFVTVVDVAVSADLRHATVYHSVLGSEEERERTEAGLQHARPYLQRVVGRELRLKYVPELRFEVDTTIERTQRIEEILAELRRRKGPGDEKPEHAP